MTGRFEEMSGAERELFEKIFPEKARKGREMPAAEPRKILNSLLFIAVGSGRLPLVRSSARRSIGIKKCCLEACHSDGRLKELQHCGELGDDLMKISRGRRLFFHAEKESWRGFSYRYKGKYVLIHLIADSAWNADSVLSVLANEYERKHIDKMIEILALKTGRSCKNVRRLAA